MSSFIMDEITPLTWDGNKGTGSMPWWRCLDMIIKGVHYSNTPLTNGGLCPLYFFHTRTELLQLKVSNTCTLNYVFSGAVYHRHLVELGCTILLAYSVLISHQVWNLWLWLHVFNSNANDSEGGGTFYLIFFFIRNFRKSRQKRFKYDNKFIASGVAGNGKIKEEWKYSSAIPMKVP